MEMARTYERTHESGNYVKLTQAGADLFAGAAD